MKKLLSLILCLILCFSLFACNAEEAQSTSGTTDTKQTAGTKNSQPSESTKPTDPANKDNVSGEPAQPFLPKYKLYAYKTCDCASSFNSGFNYIDYVEMSEYDVFMPEVISVTLAGKEYTCSLVSKTPTRSMYNNFLTSRYLDDAGNSFDIDADGKLHSATLKRVVHSENDPTLSLGQLQEIAEGCIQDIISGSVSDYKMSYSSSDIVDVTHYFRFEKYIGDVKTSEYVSIALSSYGDVERIYSSMLNKIPSDRDYSFIDMEEISEIIDYVSLKWKNTSSDKNREVSVTGIIFSLIQNDIPCFIVDFKLGGDKAVMWDNGHLMRLIICYE